jgi:hypothetical protein
MAVLIVTVLAVLTSGVADAAAAGTRSFDAALSLTGDCSVDAKLDPVPDPGCPGGTHPPAGPFRSTRSIATDAYGNIYVASFGNENSNGREGRIDIFTPSGHFITEVADPHGPKNITVDDEGNLYVYDYTAALVVEEVTYSELVRFTPTTYNPAAGEIAYGAAPVVVDSDHGGIVAGLAIDRSTGHLFEASGGGITEYSSAAEGNVILDENINYSPTAETFFPAGLAVNSANGRLYANSGIQEGVIKVFELSAPHAQIQTIERSETPAGGSFSGSASVAVDEGNGHVFVYDAESTNKIFEFAEDGSYLATIEHGFVPVTGAGLTVDNGPHSPNGVLSATGRYLFVASGNTGAGHAFAFSANPVECAPEVAGATIDGVTESEAVLRGGVNSCHAKTSYVFEYTPEWAYEEDGFAQAVVAGRGDLPAGGLTEAVNAPVSGLEAGRSYRFRLVASNALGSSSSEGSFSTYPANPASSSCSNAATRIGLSVGLPDCRAYELVTPAVTNARAPLGLGWLGPKFLTLPASPDGERVSFNIEGGVIPGAGGAGGTGSYASDPYLASRSGAGWTTSYLGPNALEAPAVDPGGHSSDQERLVWQTGSTAGSASLGEQNGVTYLSSPTGTSELLGRGSIGTDPFVTPDFISDGGSHIIFTSGDTGRQPVQIESDAPPSGTAAIYDRTPSGTHVISLLPGDITPAPGELAEYAGVSRDGRGVAFKIGLGVEAPLYLRYDDRVTFKIGEGVRFAGLSEDGKRLFYLENGKLFAFDVETESAIPFSAGAEVTVVNVSGNGSTAYFISHGVLSKSPNSAGQKPKSGKENLYRSEEGTVSFIGTVTSRDVEGVHENVTTDGLGVWTEMVGQGSLAADPSRATPDGRYLLFQSRAALGSYEPGGHSEIYLYDAVDAELSCLSCMPTGAAATGEASLESVASQANTPQPLTSQSLVENLVSDGRQVFFQSTEALVPADTDGLQDVYEWEASGVGSCDRAKGCVSLISSGHSAQANYLWAVDASGDNVFFRSPDRLLASDAESTASIYDARVDGGFPEPKVDEGCQGEGCRPALSPAPALPSPGLSTPGSEDNLKRASSCPKGKKKVKSHGTGRCVKRSRHGATRSRKGHSGAKHVHRHAKRGANK